MKIKKNNLTNFVNFRNFSTYCFFFFTSDMPSIFKSELNCSETQSYREGINRPKISVVKQPSDGRIITPVISDGELFCHRFPLLLSPDKPIFTRLMRTNKNGAAHSNYSKVQKIIAFHYGKFLSKFIFSYH